MPSVITVFLSSLTPVPNANFMPTPAPSSSAIHPTPPPSVQEGFSSLYVHATQQAQPQSEAGISQGPASAFCTSSLN